MHSVQEVIKAFSNGEMVLLVDDDLAREGETDLVVAAAKITPEQVRFMAHRGGGLLCVAMSPELLDRLLIPAMTTENNDPFKTAWAMSVDNIGTGSGISAVARAQTIQALANSNSVATDFTKPGHIFPLRAKPAGLTERRGHTESSVTLAYLAGLPSASAICELMMPDGTMATTQDAELFAKTEGLKICTIGQLVEYLGCV